MKKHIFKLAGLLVAFIFVLYACKKGDTGPQGSAGTNGNANVKSTTLTATWKWDSNNMWATAGWGNISILTSDVNNNGAVMLYEMTSANSWRAVPYTRVLNANLHEYMWFSYQADSLTVYASYSDNSNPGLSGGTYKVVCIPSSMIKPGVNPNSYPEMKKAYDLKD